MGNPYESFEGWLNQDEFSVRREVHPTTTARASRDHPKWLPAGFDGAHPWPLQWGGPEVTQAHFNAHESINRGIQSQVENAGRRFAERAAGIQISGQKLRLFATATAVRYKELNLLARATYSFELVWDGHVERIGEITIEQSLTQEQRTALVEGTVVPNPGSADILIDYKGKRIVIKPRRMVVIPKPDLLATGRHRMSRVIEGFRRLGDESGPSPRTSGGGTSGGGTGGGTSGGGSPPPSTPPAAPPPPPAPAAPPATQSATGADGDARATSNGRPQPQSRQLGNRMNSSPTGNGTQPSSTPSIASHPGAHPASASTMSGGPASREGRVSSTARRLASEIANTHAQVEWLSKTATTLNWFFSAWSAYTALMDAAKAMSLAAAALAGGPYRKEVEEANQLARRAREIDAQFGRMSLLKGQMPTSADEEWDSWSELRDIQNEYLFMDLQLAEADKAMAQSLGSIEKQVRELSDEMQSKLMATGMLQVTSLAIGEATLFAEAANRMIGSLSEAHESLLSARGWARHHGQLARAAVKTLEIRIQQLDPKAGQFNFSPDKIRGVSLNRFTWRRFRP